MSPENSVLVTGAKTLTTADAGIIQRVQNDTIITLPATVNGLVFHIENAGAVITGAPVGAVKGNTSSQVTVAPVAADGFTGNGYTPTVNKAAINTKATAKVGDRITIYGTGSTGVGAWIIGRATGTWDRAA